MSRRRPPCKVCRIEQADPIRGTHDTCEGCYKAARDTESPLDLGGTWVLNPATRTRVWVPDPTPLHLPARPRATRKATAA